MPGMAALCAVMFSAPHTAFARILPEIVRRFCLDALRNIKKRIYYAPVYFFARVGNAL